MKSLAFLNRLLVLSVLVAPWVAPIAAPEADRALKAPAVTTGEHRVALVIGNAAYKESPLRNPVNDARAIASALRLVGFKVIERTDATQKQMNRAITEFGNTLTPDSVALFYFAGHGMQVKGRNFLIPVDAEIGNESAVKTEAVDVDSVLEQISGNGTNLNLVILDACRNNPFERKFRSSGGSGLAQMDAPKGTLIAYATAPGRTASDGTGANGLYTQELLKQIARPGLRVEEVFKRVRQSVAKATNDQQLPWESSSLTGDFYFKPVKVAASDQAAGRPAITSVDAESWRAALQINTADSYRVYLEDHPTGAYARMAQAAIRKLTPSAPAAVSSAIPAPAPAVSPPPAPVAPTAAAPTSFGPQVGDVWVYELSDRYSGRQREVKLSVDKVDAKSVSEVIELEEGRLLRARRDTGFGNLVSATLRFGANANFLIELNPYTEAVRRFIRGELQSLPELSLEGLPCRGRALRQGTETVEVPDGTFEARRITVECALPPQALGPLQSHESEIPASLTLDLWYAQDLYRPVMVRKVLVGTPTNQRPHGLRESDEFRLVSNRRDGETGGQKILSAAFRAKAPIESVEAAPVEATILNIGNLAESPRAGDLWSYLMTDLYSDKTQEFRIRIATIDSKSVGEVVEHEDGRAANTRQNTASDSLVVSARSLGQGNGFLLELNPYSEAIRSFIVGKNTLAPNLTLNGHPCPGTLVRKGKEDVIVSGTSVNAHHITINCWLSGKSLAGFTTQDSDTTAKLSLDLWYADSHYRPILVRKVIDTPTTNQKPHGLRERDEFRLLSVTRK